VTVVTPSPTTSARPVPSMVATDGAKLAHAARRASLRLLPSERDSAAKNRTCPSLTTGDSGVTAIDTSVGGVTVHVDEPDRPYTRTLMVVPSSMPTGSPDRSTVATSTFELDQVASVETSPVLSSVNVSVTES